VGVWIIGLFPPSHFVPNLEMCDRATARPRQARYRRPQTAESTVLSGGALCTCAPLSTSQGAGAAAERAG